MTSKQKEKPIAKQQKRKGHFYMAKIHKQLKRYDDMIYQVGQLVRSSALGRVGMGEELNEEQRKLLCLAFKLVIDQRREAITKLDQKVQNEKPSQKQLQIIENLKSMLMEEIADYSKGFVGLFKDSNRGQREDTDQQFTENQDLFMITTIQNTEIKAFYCKLLADHYRYILKYDQSLKEKYNSIVAKCQKRYKKALQILKQQRNPLHQVKLGATLNYSVFLYQIRKNTEKALEISELAYNECQRYMNKHYDKEVPDSIYYILQMLENNCNLWRQ